LFPSHDLCLSFLARERSRRYRERHREEINARYRQVDKEERNAKQQEWRNKNRDHYNELSRSYYAKDPDKFKERRKEYREKNKEKEKERERIYREKNREKRNAASAEYYHANKDEIRRKKIRDKITNGLKIRVRDRARAAFRTAKRLGCKIGKLSHLKKFYHEAFSKINNCYYCGRKCGDTVDLAAEVDHKTPLCRNGDHDLPNLVIACKQCNTMKGKRTEVEFREYLVLYREVQEEIRKENEQEP